MGNLYLYFSGTGNTKYVIDKFSFLYDDEYIKQSIEYQSFNYHKAILEASTVIIAYPIHASMMPFIMDKFLDTYKEDFRNKEIITIVTQMSYSGDGGALAYYKLKSVKVKILHSIHIRMPVNISDFFLFKIQSIEEINKIILKADNSIKDIVNKIKSGKTIKMGRRFYSRILGFTIQRGISKPFLKKLRKRLYINHDKCITCNKCIDVCPMKNLYLEDNLIKTKNICTLCYRCINICPSQAISLFTKKAPNTQYIRDKFN